MAKRKDQGRIAFYVRHQGCTASLQLPIQAVRKQTATKSTELAVNYLHAIPRCLVLDVLACLLNPPSLRPQPFMHGASEAIMSNAICVTGWWIVQTKVACMIQKHVGDKPACCTTVPGC